MKILLVEDGADGDPAVREALAALGHELQVADSGARAFELYSRERPQLVITDVYTPGMDGFALTRAVQALAAPAWQPVLFLSRHRDDDLQVRALRAGADAYLVRPVAAELLEARLEAVERLLRLQGQAERQVSRLEHYWLVEEDEKRVARHLLEHLVDADKLADPALRHWISPAAGFCGGVVAAARTPAGVLHVMLADGTGHGLAAAINLLPVFAPFYSMTEKGFGIDAIAGELNAKVRGFLPGERFVAATLAAIDFGAGVVGIWNGGNPEPVLLGPQCSRAFAESHVPLGILSDEDFDGHVDVHAFADASHLFLYSDGLLEAALPQGPAFGAERLARVLVNAEPARRFEALRDAVTAHLEGHPAHDDIALAVAACDLAHAAVQPAAPPARALPRLAGERCGTWRGTLRLSAAEIRYVDIVPAMLGLASQFDGARGHADRVFVVLSELFNNALDHGLLGLDSCLKHQPDGIERYLAERAARLAALAEGEIELELEQRAGPGGGTLRISCRDSGPGFDHAALATAAAPDDLPSGRGLLLLRALCAELAFNAAGNHVTAVLALEGRSGPD